MNHLAVSAILSDLPDGDAWLRVLLERHDAEWTLRYGLVTVGREPATWPGESWLYESVAFVASTIPIATLVEWVASADGTLPLGEITVPLPPLQSTAQLFHRPSFELHDRERSPRPSFEYAVNREGGPSAHTSTAGRSDFLIGPDSPSFTDLDSAYRAFFLGSYDVPANASVPSELLHIRVIDERAWLGPIHITATQMTVEVRGKEVTGTVLQYFSPMRRTRLALDGADVVTIELPDGLPASNAWLWLTQGTDWRDYRALTPPWASAEQLTAAGVEVGQTSRDEQAVVEAIVYGGEGPFVEFKGTAPRAGASQTDRAFNTIAAFANGAGGTVVFGVDRDELTVLGLADNVDPNKERDRIGQLIRTRILPTPDFAITPYTVADKIILLVEVKPGAAPPYGVITDLNHRDQPQFYIRRGASTYPAQPSDLNELFHRVAAAAAQTGFPRYLR